MIIPADDKSIVLRIPVAVFRGTDLSRSVLDKHPVDDENNHPRGLGALCSKNPIEDELTSILRDPTPG